MVVADDPVWFTPELEDFVEGKSRAWSPQQRQC